MSVSAELPSTSFGPYRVLREIGRGGMGTVWLAEIAGPIDLSEPPADEDPPVDDGVSHQIATKDLLVLPEGTRIAVKTFHPHLVSTHDFARRFRREARVGASIRHPNVVRTLDAGTAPLRGVATNYLAMEFVEGQTLRELMREMGRVPESLARDVARQVALGLAAIHRAGITHRDLKPENVILTRDHQVKLMDLGVAKVREESIRLSLTGQFLGSVHYAAPEQFRAPETVDARADLYAVGVLLYEMLSGTNPFFHDDLCVVLRKSLSESPRRLALVAPDVGPVLDQLTSTLLEKAPEERVATADEVADALARGEESEWWARTGRALWSRTAARAVRRLPVARDAPLVGREDEVASLVHEFEDAAAGHRRVVILEGEAGIGKTRLIDEFLGVLAERGASFRVLVGAAKAAGTARPYHAFSEALLEGLGGGDPVGALRSLLPSDAPVAEFAALVTAAGGAEMPLDRARPLFAAAFRGLAAAEPLVLVVDDLHLAQENTARLLSYLAHDDPATPILVVAAFRPVDESHPLHAVAHGRAEGNVMRLPLGRLGPREVGALLRHVLRSERLVQELGFRLLEKTEGNPFFLLEVLRSLQSDPTVLRRRDDGGWTLAGSRVEIHVPDSVRDLVRTGLADLPEEDRELLEVAAVTGAEFDPDVVSEVLGQPKLATLRRLSALERRHRLVHAAGRRVRFDHPQLRETLYEGLMEGLREELHAQVGAVLGRRLGTAKGPDGAARLEVLHHLVLGGRPEEAAAHVVAGLEHAARTYDTTRGTDLARRFLEAAGDGAPPALRAEVRLLLAGFLGHVGERREETEALGAAREEAAASGDRALLRRVLERRLLVEFGSGDFEGAAADCRGAFRLATRAKDRDGALAALVNLGAARRCLGRYEAAATALRRALAFLVHEQSTVRRTVVLASLASVEVQRGRRRTAQRHFLEAVAAAAPLGIGDAGDLSASRHPEQDELRDRFLGLSRALGRSAEARVGGERAVLLGTDLPRRLREGAALLALAEVATLLGQHDDARGLLLGALRAGRDAADARFEATILHALGESALDCRAPEVARKWFTDALEIRRRIGHRPGVCETLLALGQVAALGGSVDSARPFLEEATELAPELGMPAVAALARATSALLHAREGRSDRAREDLDRAHEVLDAPGPLSVSSRIEGLWFAALAARALGDGDAARQHLSRAWTILEAVAARMGPDERRAFLSETSPNREIAEAVRVSGT